MLQSPSLRQNLMTNDAYQFLRRELEKVDEQILEPLSGTDWPRDMPVITGGGLVDSIASVDVTYASSGQEDDNLFYDAYNDIPVIQADLSKQIARTFNFAEYMAFPTMEDLIQSHKALKPVKSKGLQDQTAAGKPKKGPLKSQCHLDKDINKGAKKTDRQRKVVSFLLSREISTNRYAKQTDGSICFRKVYNTIVRLLCRGSLLPTGI